MKAILVIDMPENCWECPCYDRSDYADGCLVLNKYNPLTHRVEAKELGCPLRPMPEKKPIWRVAKILADNVEEEINSNQTQYARGWNDCLDEIGGEDEAL